MATDMDIDYTSPITSDLVQRWRSYVSPFPLPPHNVPMGGAPLKDIADDVLLKAPPAMIAHVQRTAAQGGLQIVSPRQAPFSSLLNRRAGNVRKLGDHEVGSIADPEAEWPTMDDADLDFLLPDQPLAPVEETITVRPKTSTRSLTKGMEDLSDPVLACLVKGRAVIDILKRDDVNGGAEEMTTLLATAWGVKESDILELDGYTLGVEGDLQRHAMKVDEVYPTLYAPMHIRSVISMGVSDVDKSVLLPDMAMDWRRMRVFCEAVFYLTCMVEGHPIKYMRGLSVPGQRSGSRDNMMVFCPGPATAWCAAPSTFSLMPDPMRKVNLGPSIPKDVRDAIQGYVRKIRPVSAVLASGRRVDSWLTGAVEAPQVPNETLASNYSLVYRSMATGNFRGRTAAATIRNAMYKVVESAPLGIRMRLVRFLTISADECKTHLGVASVPDTVVRSLSRKFVELGTYMRERIMKEAERRGETIASWWEDALAQVPDDYALLRDTPEGWAAVGVWMAFREPTDRWRKLKVAMQYRALAAAAMESVGMIELPAERGSIERLVVAAQHAGKQISKSFAGFYLGVADVGHAVAEAAFEMGKTRTALHLKEGAYLWTLRARSLRALNISPIAHEERKKSRNHLRVPAEPVDLILKPAPYKPFRSWKKHIKESSEIPLSTKRMVEEADADDSDDLGRKSSAFSKMVRPLIPCVGSTVTRYLLAPWDLGSDLEKGWAELKADMTEVARKMSVEAEVARTAKRTKAVSVTSTDVLAEATDAAPKRQKTEEVSDNQLKDFWDIYATAGEDIATGIDDELERFPEDVSALFYEGKFKDLGHIAREIEKAKTMIEATSRPTDETVR